MSTAEENTTAVEAGEGAEPQTSAAERPAEEQTETAVTDAKAGATDQDAEKPKKLNMLKVTAKPDEKNYSNNVKTDPSKLPDSDDPVEICRQVEFYFNNSNLPYDKYLWQLTGGPENKPVPIKDICKFSRMRRFPSYDSVVSALKNSKFLDVVGEAGAEGVKRKEAYEPGGKRQLIDAASVYVKGFGDEEPTTQFDIEAFFTKYFPINAVRLRRTEQKMFKGSVFVEFQEIEHAKAFVALDPAPKWKDYDLMIMLKTDYCAGKSEMIRNGDIEPSDSRPRKFYEGREGNFRDRGGKRGGKFDKDNWKERREHDQKHGFRDRDHKNGRGRDRGRGRGRGRGDYDRRDRKGDRAATPEFNPNDVKPKINVLPTETEADPNNTTETKLEKAKDPKTTTEDTNGATTNVNGKRAREDDGGAAASAEPAAKKVDSKTEVAA